MIVIKPSDLKYKYPRNVRCRFEKKFAGKPDARPFDRDDLYEILPLLAVVMDELGSDQGCVLHLLEDILNRDLPRFVTTREEVFDFLLHVARARLE